MFLSRKEAAEKIGVDVKFLKWLDRKARLIPVKKFPFVRYSVEQIDQYIWETRPRWTS